jgi:hypothetical protein
VHDEFHAGDHSQHPLVPASLCKNGDPRACWFSSLISVKSRDAGRSFERITSPARPNGIVVAGPVRYAADAGAQGAPAHRHIIEKDGFWYTMPACACARGKCVYRSDNISNPDSWKGWDGAAYSVPVFDPYSEPPLSNASIKAHCPKAVNTRLSGGLNYLSVVGEFVVLGTVLNEDKFGEVAYQSSKDLIAWSDPVSLIRLNHTAGIRDGKGALYPTMLDPASSRRNFDRFGSAGHIYWTEFACSNPAGACWERDVVRRPLRLVQ